MKSSTKSKLILVLETIGLLLTKCGGPGGTPGPCPVGGHGGGHGGGVSKVAHHAAEAHSHTEVAVAKSKKTYPENSPAWQTSHAKIAEGNSKVAVTSTRKLEFSNDNHYSREKHQDAIKHRRMAAKSHENAASEHKTKADKLSGKQAVLHNDAAESHRRAHSSHISAMNAHKDAHDAL